MVTPTSHFFAFHWLLAQTQFCGRMHLPLSPNSNTYTGQGHILISSIGCTWFQHPPYSQHLWAWWHFGNHLVDIILEQMQLSQHPLIHSTCGHDDISVITPVLSICQQHPLYSHQQVTLIYYKWCSSLTHLVWCRVLLWGAGTSSSNPLNPDQHYLLQARDVKFCVKSEANWENDWRHNITITCDHLKYCDVDCVFDFHKYEPVLILISNHYEIFILELLCECQAVQQAIYKILENWIV